MTFANRDLQRLMQTPSTDLQESAEQANLCMEDRISATRQATYEAAVGSPGDWKAWQDRHRRYVREEVNRPRPLSAAFDNGQPSLRPNIDPNQYLYRVEKIDDLLSRYESEYPLEAAQVNEWIKERESNKPSGYTLDTLTDLLNDERSDGRPTFAVFEDDFPGLERSADWAKQMCNRCGLGRHFTNGNVTLALFRYRVWEVMKGSSWPGRTLFAVPTVLNQTMNNVFFPAPRSSDGLAVGLAPKHDCSHLTVEIIHARMDYQAHHWMRVDTVNGRRLSQNDVRNLRKAHLSCIRRRSGAANYGKGCV